MEGRDVNRRPSSPTDRPFLTNTSGGMGTLTRTGPGGMGTLPRGTLTRNKPGNQYQSGPGGYDTMDTLKRSRSLATEAGTMPRGHKPVSDFDPDYEAVEDDNAIRKLDLGSQNPAGYSNPSYDDEDDFEY